MALLLVNDSNGKMITLCSFLSYYLLTKCNLKINLVSLLN